MRERFTAVWPHWGLTALTSEIPTAEQLSYIHYQTTRARGVPTMDHPWNRIRFRSKRSV